MLNIGPTELILILGVALVIFGPGKLPELGQTFLPAIPVHSESIWCVTHPNAP